MGRRGGRDLRRKAAPQAAAFIQDFEIKELAIARDTLQQQLDASSAECWGMRPRGRPGLKEMPSTKIGRVGDRHGKSEHRPASS